MKRIICVVMVCILLCSFSACNNQEPAPEKVDNSIALTMDNYKNYLSIDYISAENAGYELFKYIDGDKYTFYSEIRFEVAVKGASPLFIYNNVKVTVEFRGGYYYADYDVDDRETKIDWDTYTFTVDVNTDVAGNGTAVYVFPSESTSRDYHTDLFESNAKVVAVSGSVTLAGG